MFLNKLQTEKHDIDSELRHRRKTVVEKTVSHKIPEILKQKVEIEEKDGWRVIRKNTKSVRMAMDKIATKQIEDDIWSILARMGFSEMSHGHDFTINVGDDVNPRQIDVFAKDKETAILVECTCCETPKKKNMSKLIEKIESIKSKVAQSINTHYGKDPKLKIRWVIATRNIEWGNADRDKAKAAKITIIRDHEISYYSKLTNHLKSAAKYQLLAHLFKKESISGLNLAVPATRGKMGGGVFYNFLIKPAELMKIVYVSHKASRDVEALDTYQRMLQPSRLKKIASYIDDGGQFPTNIVINLKTNKELRFDKKESIGNSAFGTLYLPNKYASAWVIDGQHRIYGYAHSQRAKNGEDDNVTVPVLAYENLSPSKEAQLFVDINCEQVRVTKNLLNEIYSTLKWDSEDINERLYALRSRIVMALDSKKASPFFDRIITTGKDKSRYRCLTLTSFSEGLKENKFFGDATKPGSLSYSPSNKLEDTMQKGTEVLLNYFSLFSDAIPDHWELGDAPGGFLCTNNAIRALLKVLKEIIIYVSAKERIEPDYLKPEELIEYIKPYVEPVIEHFSSAPDEEIARFRSRQALKGVRKNALSMMQLINSTYKDFTSPDLEEYLATIDEDGTKEARELIDEIQLKLFGFVLQTLKNEFDDEWWYEGIPTPVRVSCTDRREIEKGKKNKEQYICLIDYYKIAHINWALFKDNLSFSKDGGKDKQLKWLKDLNEIRNITHHSEKWPATKDQVSEVRGIYDNIMQKIGTNANNELLETVI